jgi:hypothetical protein
MMPIMAVEFVAARHDPELGSPEGVKFAIYALKSI